MQPWLQKQLNSSRKTIWWFQCNNLQTNAEIWKYVQMKCFIDHWFKLLLHLVVTFYSIYAILNSFKRLKSLWQIKHCLRENLPRAIWNVYANIYLNFVKEMKIYKRFCSDIMFRKLEYPEMNFNYSITNCKVLKYLNMMSIKSFIKAKWHYKVLQFIYVLYL